MYHGNFHNLLQHCCDNTRNRAKLYNFSLPQAALSSLRNALFTITGSAKTASSHSSAGFRAFFGKCQMVLNQRFKGQIGRSAEHLQEIRLICFRKSSKFEWIAPHTLRSPPLCAAWLARQRRGISSCSVFAVKLTSQAQHVSAAGRVQRLLRRCGLLRLHGCTARQAPCTSRRSNTLRARAKVRSLRLHPTAAKPTQAHRYPQRLHDGPAGSL